jgi:hypothetical protein
MPIQNRSFNSAPECNGSTGKERTQGLQVGSHCGLRYHASGDAFFLKPQGLHEHRWIFHECQSENDTAVFSICACHPWTEYECKCLPKRILDPNSTPNPRILIFLDTHHRLTIFRHMGPKLDSAFEKHIYLQVYESSNNGQPEIQHRTDAHVRPIRWWLVLEEGTFEGFGGLHLA